ncbi:MAG: cupin domain-containing protein [Lachnoclostridium sp.]|nr:cupin domain-containing protein [Lachnoclostridium sp.]
MSIFTGGEQGSIRRILYDIASDDSKYSSICTVEISPNQCVTPAHSHPHEEESVYIITGKGKVLIGEEVLPISPGSLLYFPPGVPHMIMNMENTPMKGICFYASESGEEVIYQYHTDIVFPEE